ncbi:MAG: rubredoxin [Clostridia bacterium]|nr:rubredoxin [Clostridia bacterium]
MKYICDICGFEYDESKESVKFEDLPEDWVCPICGVGKDSFSKAE